MADIGFAQYIVILYTCCCLEMATKEGNNALAQCDSSQLLNWGSESNIDTLECLW